MTKSVYTIGREKFLKLSSRRQHELLADLAKDFLTKNDYICFKEKYDMLHSWTHLDRYSPPHWLTPEEALHEYIAFHNNFSIQKKDIPNDKLTSDSISWQASFNVEIAIDQVRSPYNVGSILRLIDNFGFKGLVHSTSWLRLDHAQLKRAAMGCDKWIPVKYVPDLTVYLKSLKIPVIGIEHDKSAIPVSEWESPEESVLILGNETYGIAESIRALCNRFVYIPIFGYKNSMNVSHAFAVIAQKIIEKVKNEKQ